MALPHYRRAFGYVLRYRRAMVALVVCVLLIGVLYSAGIGSTLPVLKIMISEEGLHGWVRRSRAESRLGAELRAGVDKDDLGLRVIRVDAPPPAGKAGTAPVPEPLQVGDDVRVIQGVAVNGKVPGGAEAALSALLDVPAGSPVKLVVHREGKDLPLTVPAPEEGALSAALGWVVGLLPEGGNNERLLALVMVLGMILTMAFWSAVARYFQEYLTEWVASRALLDLRCQAFDSALRTRMADIGAAGVNDIFTRFGKEYEDLRDGLVQVLGRALREPIKAAAVIGVAFWLDWTLTLASVFAVPLVVVILRRLGKRMHRAARKALESTGAMNAVVQQSLLGLRVVKGYTAEGAERVRFLRENRAYVKYTMRFKRAEAMAEPLLEFLATAGASFMAVWAAYLVFSGAMRPEHFFAFIVCMVALADPARKLSAVMSKVRKADAAAARIFEIIDRPAESGDSGVGSPDPDAGPAGARRGPPVGSDVGPLATALEFRDISFGYRDGQTVLAGVSLAVPAGRTFAFVGPNGSGKTTLLSLVPRFYDPTAGAVLWDGRDVRELNVRRLRKHVGLVTQDAVIFKDTVHANIAYGSGGADRAAVESAARRARAHDFITGIRDPEGRTGYDAVLAEHGQSLSGGQRQRIALARAILRDPAVLILDEATSQIDAESEGLIQEALEDFRRGRTTLVIAHRLSTTRSADRIVVMEDGRILDVGSHEGLLRSCGLYRRLCERQFFEGPGPDGADRPPTDEGEAMLPTEPASPSGKLATGAAAALSDAVTPMN